MDKATRIKVAAELNKHYGGKRFTENDVKKFEKVNKFGPGGARCHYDVYAMQYGDLTILVWIRLDGSIEVKGQAW